MGSNVVLKEFKILLLPLSMGQNAVLESTIAAFCVENLKALTWTDVTFDLIAESKYV